MGAWIETYFCLVATFLYVVAPYVGAWIETHNMSYVWRNTQVAPYVGAWIETGKQMGLAVKT